jgi:hypothetical protein
MASNYKLTDATRLFTLVIVLFLLANAGPCRAQATPSAQPDTYAFETDGVNATAQTITFVDPAESKAQSPTPVAAAASASAADSGWHLTVSPYLWFPGVHGTVGAFNRDASVHASPADLLSHFRFGLMGLVEPRYNRWVLPIDVMWVRLGANNTLANLPNVTANVKGSEFILTPKVGYRIVNQEKLKIDALTGFRYWHFGQNLSFNPSLLGLNFSASQNWVDPLVGGKIEGALSPRFSVTVAGDVGGWGVGSQLDYQIVGAMGYKIKPNLTLAAGYRYLYVDYRNGGSVADLVTSGVFLGLSIALK